MTEPLKKLCTPSKQQAATWCKVQVEPTAVHASLNFPALLCTLGLFINAVESGSSALIHE